MWAAKLVCTNCHAEWDDPFLWCPACNGLVVVPTIKGPPASEITLHSIWDLQAFLPQFRNIISMGEGATPIFQLKNIPALQNLRVKLEFRNPTGSFRDRAASLLMSDLVSKGKSLVFGASTGSFNVSLGAYAANANICLKNVVPQSLELSKIEQMKVYGSEVIQIGDTVDDAIAYAQQQSEQEGGYLPTPESNALTIEGQKTIGLELALQEPSIDTILVPRGSGSLIFSIYQGLKDAQASGWIRNMPVLYSVALKHTSAAYLVESLETTTTRLLGEVSAILNETNGTEIEIDGEIMMDDALELARREGYFIEPASASVISAAKRLSEEGTIVPERTVAILTGSGMNALNAFASQMRGMKKVVWGLSTSSTAKFEILNLIAEKKVTHGYAIWVSTGKVHSLQSIYQHLAELENKGLVIAESGERRKKLYSVTRKGYETLEKMRDLIDFV